jgi:hypothetical protein
LRLPTLRWNATDPRSRASSYRDGTNRVFLDSPRAEWLWEFAEANDIWFEKGNYFCIGFPIAGAQKIVRIDLKDSTVTKFFIECEKL